MIFLQFYAVAHLKQHNIIKIDRMNILFLHVQHIDIYQASHANLTILSPQHYFKIKYK